MTLVADVTKEWLALRNHVTNRWSRINIPDEVTDIVVSYFLWAISWGGDLDREELVREGPPSTLTVNTCSAQRGLP